MSIQITCPHCGKRPIEEYVYGEVPVVPQSIVDLDERDIDRAYNLHNTEGVQREAWFHLFGCRRWLYLFRDTVSNEIQYEE